MSNESKDGFDPEVEREELRFLTRFHQDVAAGQTASAEEYLSRFPRAANLIAHEFAPKTSVPAHEGQGEPRRIGRFTIERELGRGGQAAVYLAEDTELKRLVALKVLENRHSDDALRRFQREAEAASRLDHPGICAIHDFGTDGPVTWIAMAYLPGDSLAHRILSANPPSDESTNVDSEATIAEEPSALRDGTRADRKEIRTWLSIFAKICDALHVAHEAGIIHRDIKPQNIIISDSDQPVILDFGLARWNDDEEATLLTHSGAILGTPAYLSPEQILSSTRELDPRTDVWSVGVSLYEALTGQRPFNAPTRQRLMQQIIAIEPSSASRVNPHIGRDLRVVLETALAKDRNARYQTACDLARDLRAILERRPIQARPAGPILRLRRWAQRSPLVAAAGLLILITIGVAFFTIGQALADERAARKEAHASEVKATQDAQTAREISKFLTGLFEDFDPIALSGRTFGAMQHPSADISAKDILARGLRKLEGKLLDRPDLRASLLDTIGNVYLNLGLRTQAEAPLREALQLRQADLGTRHIDTVSSIQSLALVRAAKGEDVTDDLSKVIALQKDLVGQDDPRIAKSTFNLALQLMANWKLEAAQPAMRESVELAALHHGKASREYALVLLAMAQLKILRDHPAEGYRDVRAAAKIIDQLDGSQEFSGLADQFMRAQLFEKLSRKEAAAKAYAHCWTEGKRILGETHYITAWAGTKYGQFLHRELRDLERASEITTTTVELYRQIYGEDSHLVIGRLVALARIKTSQKQYDQRLAAIREALAICRKQSHRTLKPKTLATVLNIAGAAEYGQSNYQRAKSHWEECLPIRRQLHGDTHKSVKDLVRKLAITHHAIEGNAKEREAILKKPRKTPQDEIDLARAYALLLNQLATQSPQEQFICQYCSNRAMSALNKAVKIGFKDFDSITSDRAFDGLRTRVDFQRLIAGQ